jgi:hypothetical protein
MADPSMLEKMSDLVTRRRVHVPTTWKTQDERLTLRLPEENATYLETHTRLLNSAAGVLRFVFPYLVQSLSSGLAAGKIAVDTDCTRWLEDFFGGKTSFPVHLNADAVQGFLWATDQTLRRLDALSQKWGLPPPPPPAAAAAAAVARIRYDTEAAGRSKVAAEFARYGAEKRWEKLDATVESLVKSAPGMDTAPAILVGTKGTMAHETFTSLRWLCVTVGHPDWNLEEDVVQRWRAHAKGTLRVVRELTKHFQLFNRLCELGYAAADARCMPGHLHGLWRRQWADARVAARNYLHHVLGVEEEHLEPVFPMNRNRGKWTVQKQLEALHQPASTTWLTCAIPVDAVWPLSKADVCPAAQQLLAHAFAQLRAASRSPPLRVFCEGTVEARRDLSEMYQQASKLVAAPSPLPELCPKTVMDARAMALEAALHPSTPLSVEGLREGIEEAWRRHGSHGEMYVDWLACGTYQLYRDIMSILGENWQVVVEHDFYAPRSQGIIPRPETPWIDLSGGPVPSPLPRATADRLVSYREVIVAHTGRPQLPRNWRAVIATLASGMRRGEAAAMERVGENLQLAMAACIKTPGLRLADVQVPERVYHERIENWSP